MIPILYESDETAFITNGVCRLNDCVSCIVTEERNGIYECDFEYPVDGVNFDEIYCGRIIAVTHDDSRDIQPFDIVSYSKPLNGIVSFHAVHISYRLTEIVCRGTNVNSLASAFAMLKNSAIPSNPFTFETDIDSGNYMAAADGIPRSARQMLGGVEGSILDSYGGEYEWDKWTVRLWRARGETKDFTIRYGLNLTDYNDDTDYFGTYTSAIPYWSKEDQGTRETVVGSKVSSDLSGYVDREICVPIDLSEKFENQPTTTQLENFVLSQMKSHNVNLPRQTIKVDFVNLDDVGAGNLYKCKLCDSIRVVFPRYGMQGEFKIVKTEYDVMLGRYSDMELGSLSTSLSEAMGIRQDTAFNASSFNLSSMFITRDASETVSVSANSGAGVTIPVPSVTGYDVIGLQSLQTTQGTSVMIGTWYFQTNNTELRVGYRNVTSSAVSCTFTATFIYAKE